MALPKLQIDSDDLPKTIENLGDVITKSFEVLEGKFKEHDGSKAEQDAKLEKAMGDINEFQQKLAAQQKAFEDLQVAMNRPGLGEKEKEDASKVSKAFGLFLQKGENQQDFAQFLDRNAASLELDLKSLTTGSDPDGGYWVTPTVLNTIMMTQIIETSPIRQLATVQSISSDSVKLPIDDNPISTGGWVGETDSRSVGTTPAIGEQLIPVFEMYAQPKASQKLLDDAGIDPEAWLAGKIADQFGRDEATAFVSGTGVAKPRGFTSYSNWTTPGTYQRNAIEQIVSGAAAAFTADGLIDLQNSLVEAYQNGAVFGMQRASWGSVRKLKDGDGQYLLGLGGNLQGNQTLQMLGKPIYFMADMPAATAGKLAAVYGNFKQGYMVVDRFGIRTLRDPFTSKPWVIFYTTRRVGGDVVNFQSLKLQKISA